MHKTVFHFLNLQKVLMNECEHSTQITHINLYFEKMAVNVLLEHLPLHQYHVFLHRLLNFRNPLYQAYEIVLQVHHLEQLLIVWHSDWSMSSEIYSVLFVKSAWIHKKQLFMKFAIYFKNTIDSHVCKKIDPPRKFIPF